MYSSWRGPLVFLDSLYVDAEFRGKGIGKALLKKVSKIALQEGFTFMRWFVQQRNDKAKDFYQKEGAQNLTIMEGFLHLQSILRSSHHHPLATVTYRGEVPSSHWISSNQEAHRLRSGLHPEGWELSRLPWACPMWDGWQIARRNRPIRRRVARGRNPSDLAKEKSGVVIKKRVEQS
uniref:N-acetyltransferase domain-containing protein n=1 Tax=Eptatretus burgeri TaxID=7764 RepID=A0A8C4R6A0_EPTBU